jgi:TadE-like protein
MKSAIKHFLKKLRYSEAGNATIEFVIVFPLMIGLLLSGFELGFVSLHQGMLERAVDMTVRDIRLGTGAQLQHDGIKQVICERAQFIKNCEDNMRLEMIQQNPRVGISIPGTADCTDNSEEVKPVRNFENGQNNDLMILRACVKISPIFPTSTLGHKISDNADNKYALVAMSAFVQEPR